MGAYVLRRLVVAALTVVAVSFVAFLAFGISFDPTYPLLAGGSAGLKTRALVRAYYHLNDPIVSQYWRWATRVVRHGFGDTISLEVTGPPPRLAAAGQPIGPQLWKASAVTAQLVGFALVLVVAGSALAGAFSSQRRRLRLDVSTRAATYVAASIPTFLFADLIRRSIVPHQSLTGFGDTTQVSGVGGSWFLIGPPTGGLVDRFRHMTLPAVALALGLIGIYSRYVRSSMVVALGAPYVSVARAKGLTERRVLLRHALRNSLVPFLSLLTLELGGVIGASIAVDAVFSLGGLASTFLNALAQADPYELTALLTVTAMVVCAFMFLGDVLVGLLDPRVSLVNP